MPLILILPALWGLDGILLTQALADALTCMVSVPFNIYFLEKVLGDGPKA